MEKRYTSLAALEAGEQGDMTKTGGCYWVFREDWGWVLDADDTQEKAAAGTRRHCTNRQL